MRAALYARVSTELQDPSMQVSALHRYAASRGFKIVRQYQDVCSGAKDSRPALDRLMADAHKGKFDALLIWKLDRLGRSLRHLLKTVDKLGTLGVELVSTTENLDTTSPSGRLLFIVIGALAEFERGLISERVRAGLQRAREKGKVIGRPRVLIDLGKVREMQGRGMSFRQIAKKIPAWRNGKLGRASPALICQRLKEEREKAQKVPRESRAESPDTGDRPQPGGALRGCGGEHPRD